MVKLSEEPVRPGKGKGSQPKDEDPQKKDDRETEQQMPKKPLNCESKQNDESKKKTPEEKNPRNPWNQFQQRMRGCGIGGEKKLLSALYREEQQALRTVRNTASLAIMGRWRVLRSQRVWGKRKAA